MTIALDPDDRMRLMAAAASVMLHASMIFMWSLSSLQGDGTSSALDDASGALFVEYMAATPQELAAHEFVQTDPSVSPELALDNIETTDVGTENPSTASDATQTSDLEKNPAESEGTMPSNTVSDSAPSSIAGGDKDSPSSGGEDDLVARYHAALRARILSAWESTEAENLPEDCNLALQLEPGGALTLASASSCQLDQEQQRKLEATALMAQPMPYVGFESVFSPAMNLSLKP